MKHESILEWRSTGSTEPDYGVCGRKSGQRDIRSTISRLFQEPQSFENVVQLIRYMADFYDSIRFPESSVVLREFSPGKACDGEITGKKYGISAADGTKRHLCHFPHLRQIPPERHLAGHLSMERRTSGDGILQCPGTDHRDGCHTGKKIKVQKKAGTLRKDKDSCFLLYRRKTSKSITFHIRVIRSQIGTK